MEEITKAARELLSQEDYDGVIDCLRTQNAPNEPEMFALLAEAYYYRGDSKGDVYSAYFFATRAIDTYYKPLKVHIIKGISAYKKGDYKEACNILGNVIKPNSASSQLFIYGLCLFHINEIENAKSVLSKAAKLAPNHPIISQGIAYAEKSKFRYTKPLDNIHKPLTGNMFDSLIESLKASKESEIDSPYTHTALSKLRGTADTHKDKYWVKYNIPCQDTCPAHTNIPEYLTAIFNKDYNEAYNINLRDNIFPGVLGRVCARPCENMCRHAWEGLGEPLAICWSKRSASDFSEDKIVTLDKYFSESGKSVTVIGAGPAGLTCARELALLGHKVKVLEKHSSPGGMMNQGIPTFRLPRNIIEHEIKQIEALGVEILCNINVGENISLSQIKSETHALIIASGTLRPNLLNLPGKELKGIYHGLDFLLHINEKCDIDVKGNVIVIGGGFTAMDSARSAVRIDSVKNVSVQYRRSKNEMLVTPGELEELAIESIPMEFMVSPVEYIGDANGHVCSVKFIRNKLGEADSSGRCRPIPIAGSEFELKADNVILATGQFPETSWIDETFTASLLDNNKKLKIYDNHNSDIENIFFAGDFATGASTLIESIGHAKICSEKVDMFLMKKKRILHKVEISDVKQTGRIREMDFIERKQMPSIETQSRKVDIEVETGYDEAIAEDETQRCYRCNYKFEIDNDKCIYCEWCIKAKPRSECIIRVKKLKYDEQGAIIGYEKAEKTEESHLIFINQTDCIRCGACKNACPVDCIDIQKVNLIKQHCTE